MKQQLTDGILNHFRVQYQAGNRNKKAELLNTLCDVHGYHHKAAVRLLNGIVRDRYGMPKAGKQPKYDSPELFDVLRNIWLQTDQMCSKKLKAAILIWLPHYELQYGALTVSTKSLLKEISSSTIDRLLKPTRLKTGRRGLAGTRPGSLLKNQIPIRTDNWDVTQSGYLEADTVAHCGNSLSGDFIWSLTMTDIFSGWTENRATWNKGADGVVKQIRSIENCLPFLMLAFDCDNGSEFLNYHLLRYFTEREANNIIQFTRSRPYKKNDNAHVEQKNWTHVRQLLGYDRLDNMQMVELINDLYSNEWSLLQNYFMPNMKLIEKIKINSKYKKKYDSPQTPYQRLLKSSQIPEMKKEALQETFSKLNPFELKAGIERKLKAIFRLTNKTRQSKGRR